MTVSANYLTEYVFAFRKPSVGWSVGNNPFRFGCVKEGKLKSSDWNEKYMYGAAKENLIRVVAQAITTYVMNVFKFPVGLWDELSQIIGDFWWGNQEEEKKGTLDGVG
jgi:hypothetical protein